MKRLAGVWILAAALSGCMSSAPHQQQCRTCGGGSGSTTTYIPGVQGPWGQPVPMQAPYSALSPGAAAAQAMMAQSVPLDVFLKQPTPTTGRNGVVQASAKSYPGSSSEIIQASGGAACGPGNLMSTPPGMALGPIGHGMTPPGAVAAVGAIQPGMPGGPPMRTSVLFQAPSGLKVSWATQGVVGGEIQVPGRYNFLQNSIYRLKLSNIPNPRVKGNLYPTLEVVTATPKTATFLAHSSVPVAFTDEDFDQVVQHNFVTKVIYLPDPAFQEIATVGTGMIVSTDLPPGTDPIAEANRRGTILLIVRLGDIDLEASNTPAMNAPGAMMGQGLPPGAMLPPGAIMTGPNGPASESMMEKPTGPSKTPATPASRNATLFEQAKNSGILQQ